MKIKTVGLCESRHEMPVSEFVYPQVIADPTDTDSLESTALDFVRAADAEGFDGVCLYVTGMSVALAAVFKAMSICSWLSFSLMHFDAKTGSYYEQVMW